MAEALSISISDVVQRHVGIRVYDTIMAAVAGSGRGVGIRSTMGVSRHRVHSQGALMRTTS
jgi:hypothetical protein